MKPAVATATVQDSIISSQWNDFLHTHGSDLVYQAALNWPENESVVFDFHLIQAKNPDLANYALEHPAHAIRMLQECIQQMDFPTATKPALAVRINNIPKALRISPRQLRAEHLGKLVAITGVVTAASQTLLHVLEACFECKVCTTRVRVLQEDESRQDPVLCETCDAQRPWRLIEAESRHIDVQHLRLQEPPESVKAGSTPEILGIRVTGDLVHKTTPGGRVVATGIATLRYKRQNGKAQTEAEPLLVGLHIQPDESEFVDLESSDEELQTFHDLAAKADVHDQLSKCLAPSVEGNAEIKQAILLSLVGGPEWIRPDGSKVRGRIHILVAGDPGTAKSKLLGLLGRYTPRCVRVLGVDASRAGLSIAAVKDPVDGRWMLEAGALVMAHNHLCTIDEMGHLDPEEDQPALLSCMEDGWVQCTKVVKATLPAAPTIIAAMNPLYGRFDRYSPFVEQLPLSAPIKSRFDLTFCLLDLVNAEGDADIADAVLADKDSGVKDERIHYGLALNGDQLRRYIFQARKLNPRMTADAQAYIKDFYGRMRSQDKENPGFTPRQLEGLRRLAGASARLRMSESIEMQDAERAVSLMLASFRSCRIMDSSGLLDGDLLQFGQSKSQHDRMRLILQCIKDLQRAHEDGYNKGHARTKDIVEACEALGIPANLVQSSLEALLRNNTIYKRRGEGTYAVLAS